MDQGLQQAQARIRVMILGLGAILIFFGSVGLVLYLKPGGGTRVQEPVAIVFVAGPIEGFEPGTVSYFEIEHLYIVRASDGRLLALYDLGPYTQALVSQGDESALECRAVFMDDEGGLAQHGSPPVGFETKVFQEPCQGSTWDAVGTRLFGPAVGDMDRFPLDIVDGVVHVDVSNRRCMNPVSAQAPCLPTQ